VWRRARMSALRSCCCTSMRPRWTSEVCSFWGR
jgi:hypothetical protein